MITNWNELTLRNWAQLREAQTIEEEGDRTIAIVAVLAGKTPDEVCDLPLAKYLKMRDAAAFVTEDLPGLTGKIASCYRVNGWRLVPAVKVEKWTAIQFIDFQTLTDRGDDALVQLLSVLLVPKGKSYGNGYDIAELQEALQDMALPDAREILHFFVQRSLLSASRGAICSPDLQKAVGVTSRKMRSLMRRLSRSFATLGGGLIVWTLSPHPLGDPGTRSSRWRSSSS